MYKKQMKFQRIVCMVMLIACAIVFAYSLGLMTDLYDSLYSTIRDPSDLDSTYVTGARILYDMQPFNRSFTIYAILMLLVNLILFIMGTHSRRRYYIGNYISVALSTIANAAMIVWAMPQIMAFKQQYLKIDFEELKSFSDRRHTYYTDSTFFFDASYVVFGILALATLLLLVNTVLKIIVMKEEKRLIGSRKDVRA